MGVDERVVGLRVVVGVGRGWVVVARAVWISGDQSRAFSSVKERRDDTQKLVRRVAKRLDGLPYYK